MKRVTELETKYFAILVIFAFNVIAGSSYAFSVVLYFLVLVPLILFNLLGLHKKGGNKIIQSVLDNLWLILCFFWLINIWTIRKYNEPHYIFSYEVAAWTWLIHHIHWLKQNLSMIKILKFPFSSLIFINFIFILHFPVWYSYYLHLLDSNTSNQQCNVFLFSSRSYEG